VKVVTPNPAPAAPAAPVPVDPARTRLAVEFKQPSPLMACRFDPAGHYVFATTRDSTILRYQLASGKKTVLSGHASWVRALGCTPDGKVLLAGDYHGKVLWWPVEDETPVPLRSVEAHNGWVRALAVSPDGQLLATCGNDHLVKLWTTADGKLVRELAGHDCHVYHTAFHPGGKDLVSCDLRGVVKHWDVDKGTVVRDLDAKVLHKFDPVFRAEHGGARGLAFRPDGGQFACCGITDVSNAFAGIGKPLVVLFDWQTGQAKLLRPKTDYQGTAWGVAFHPAGFIVCAGGGRDGALWFWKPDQTSSFHTQPLPANTRDLALHPDGGRLATAQIDGAVRVYSMETRTAG
jgi:WD40 repeat protein